MIYVLATGLGLIGYGLATFIGAGVGCLLAFGFAVWMNS